MVIWACFKEMHHKTLWLWQLFVHNAYEKQNILLLRTISVLIAQLGRGVEMELYWNEPGESWQGTL